MMGSRVHVPANMGTCVVVLCLCCLVHVEALRQACLLPKESHHRDTKKTVRKDSYLVVYGRLCLQCHGTRAETRFRLSAKRTSPFKSAGASVQSTTGSRGARISGSNAGYTMFRGSVKDTGYPFYSSLSPSLPLLCVTVCHHISTGLYLVTGCAVAGNSKEQYVFIFKDQ